MYTCTCVCVAYVYNIGKKKKVTTRSFLHRTHPTPASLSVSTTPKKHSATDLESGSATDFESPKGSASALQSNKLSDEGSGTQQGGFRFQGSDNTPGIDAVKKLRIHYIVNKVSCYT